MEPILRSKRLYAASEGVVGAKLIANMDGDVHLWKRSSGFIVG